MMRTARLALLLSPALFIAACVAARRFDPPPAAGPVADAGQRLGYAADSMARGRDLLVARCQRCHSLVPPQDHTPGQWARILPRMARKARLTDAQAADVRAYILAAHEAASP